jgi:hypothetical protein
MDQMIMGPLIILLMGGGVGAAFYFVAQRYVGSATGASTYDTARVASDQSLHAPDARR